MYYTTESYSIYYEKHGTKGKNILILPGWGETRNTFRYLIEQLKENNQVYIIDYPGFGNSIFPNKNLTIYDYANIISSFLNDLEIENPTIIAHSFGGRISILLDGYFNEDIDKLILIDAAGIKQKKSLHSRFKTTVYKLLKKLKIFLPKRKQEEYLQKLFTHFASTDYNNLDEKMRTTFKNIVNTDLSGYLKNMKTETLILWGKLDQATPIKDGIKMNKEIKDSALIIFPNCSHFPYLEEPLLTFKIIKEFIH